MLNLTLTLEKYKTCVKFQKEYYIPLKKLGEKSEWLKVM